MTYLEFNNAMNKLGMNTTIVKTPSDAQDEYNRVSVFDSKTKETVAKVFEDKEQHATLFDESNQAINTLVNEFAETKLADRNYNEVGDSLAGEHGDLIAY